jgi:conjugal transfer/entry exclusion protein
VKNKTLSFPKQILMSLLLTSILLGFDVKPAQAQWTVFDPSQYALQIAKKIEEASRWVETINHYVSMYEKAVQQYEKMVESVTNLRGILDKVDEQITRHKQLITTYAQLGKLIRGTFELKRRIENTITSQIQSVVNISRRLRNGIFDMDQNKRDLDDFLRHSIGRRADAELQNLERLAKLDSELERMLYDREMILLDLAKLYEEREKIADKIRAIDTTNPANQDGVQSLIDQMLAVNLRITTVEGQLRELEAKIQEKFVKYGIKIEQMTKFGDEIRQSNEMMTGITRASDEFLQELEHYDVWREEIYDNNLP